MDFIRRVSFRTVRVLAACVASVAIPLAAHPGSASAQLGDFTVAVRQVPDLPIFTGAAVAYVVAVTSAGALASPAAVRVTLPSEFRDVAATPSAASGFTCTRPSPTVVSCTRGLLAGTAEVRVTATAPSSIGSDGDNYTVTAHVDPGRAVSEINEQNNAASVTTRVETGPDLDVDLSGSSTTADVGDEITYVLRLLNVGDGGTAVVNLRATLPQQVAFVRFEPVEGQQFSFNACARDGQVITCRPGSTAPGQTLAVRIVARVTSSAGDSQILFGATADPSNSIRERNENNNSASVLTTVRAVSDLVISGTVSKARVSGASLPLGGSEVASVAVTLTLTVRNNGPSSSPPTTVTVNWPAGSQNGVGFCPGGSQLQDGSCIPGQVTNCFNTCSVGTVLPGGSQVVTAVAVVASLPIRGLSITATVDAAGTVVETNNGNNSVTLNILIP